MNALLTSLEEMQEHFLWDIDRFPLPICFDERVEAQEMWRRDEKVKAICERWWKIYKK